MNQTPASQRKPGDRAAPASLDTALAELRRLFGPVPSPMRPAWESEVHRLRAALATLGLIGLFGLTLVAGLAPWPAAGLDLPAVHPAAATADAWLRWFVMLPILALLLARHGWPAELPPRALLRLLGLSTAAAVLGWLAGSGQAAAWEIAAFVGLAIALCGLPVRWSPAVAAAGIAGFWSAASHAAPLSVLADPAMQLIGGVGLAALALGWAIEGLLSSTALARVELADARRRTEAAHVAWARFIAAASHDLRQPLHALAFLAHGLRRRLRDDAVDDTLRRIEQSAQSIDHMLGDLLELSKLDAGALKLGVEPVQLVAVFEALQTEFLPLAQSKGVTLKIHKTDLVCRSDAVALQRILSNLVSNALRCTDHGAVVVRGAGNGRRVRIQVRDTGVGIEPADSERIFEEFQQIQRGRGGVGLGLAIVKRLCVALGHRIDVDSKPGQGSTFTLTAEEAPPVARRPAAVLADLAAAAAAPAAREASKSPATAQAGPKSVLLYIEDDAQVRNAVLPVLESWGYTVVDATDAREAETKLSELLTVPDVMVVDHDLGGGQTSAQVVAHIHGIYGQAIPSLIVTGNREAAEAFGGESTMVKPVDPERLRAAVEAARRAGPQKK